jgi:hypothetical protein
MQVSEVADVVDNERTTWTTRLRPTVHAGGKHEMVEDELSAAIEQIDQPRPAV